MTLPHDVNSHVVFGSGGIHDISGLYIGLCVPAQLANNVIFLFIVVTTTSTAGSDNEHSAFIRENNNNNVSEDTHDSVDVKRFCKGEKLSPSESEFFFHIRLPLFLLYCLSLIMHKTVIILNCLCHCYPAFHHEMIPTESVNR